MVKKVPHDVDTTVLDIMQTMPVNEFNALFQMFLNTKLMGLTATISTVKVTLLCEGRFRSTGWMPSIHMHAPVVSWTMVCLLLILLVVLSLTSKQVDYTAAFVQSKLNIHEKVFAAMPRGFREEGQVHLRLKRALYSLKQSPWMWCKHLKRNSVAWGFKQNPNGHCFYTDDFICLPVYVGNSVLPFK
jgi:hypothetical protein